MVAQITGSPYMDAYRTFSVLANYLQITCIFIDMYNCNNMTVTETCSLTWINKQNYSVVIQYFVNNYIMIENVSFP